MGRALTIKTIESLKPHPKKRVEVPDPALSGLYMVVQPSGAKSWAIRYRFAGKPRKLTLGKWPIIGLANARLAASEALAAVEEGRDPGAEKIVAKRERAEQVGRNTVRTLVERFDRLHLSKLKSGRDVRRFFLDPYLVARWGERDVQAITKRDVIELIDEIAESGRVTMANRVRAHLSKFFSWLADRDIIDASPVLGVKPVAKERTRDRVLNDNEVRLFWQACEEMGQPWGAFGQLLLLTGQRRSEVAGMTDDEVGEEVWRLAGDRTKNGRAHNVPLSKAARNVLSGLERVNSPSGYIFTTTGKTPVSGFQKARLNVAEHMARIASDERGEPVEIEHFTWHDLRRTAATGLARLGVPVRVTEAVLNHVSGTGGGIVEVYQRHDYADEKRQALEAWGKFVMRLVEGSADNVTSLRQGGK